MRFRRVTGKGKGQHPLARNYWLEVDRVMAASGYEDADAKATAAAALALKEIVGAIIMFEERSITGLVIKAQAMQAWSFVDNFQRALDLDATKWADAMTATIIRQAGGCRVTCGLCTLEAFRPSTGGRQMGYAAYPNPHVASLGRAIPNPHFMGCEMILTDIAQGNIANHPGYRMLLKILRKGDRLVIDSPKSLRTKPHRAEKRMQTIKDMGVKVMVLTYECDGLRCAA